MIIIDEIGNIFLYVAELGFSDYIVNHYRLKDYKYYIHISNRYTNCMYRLKIQKEIFKFLV